MERKPSGLHATAQDLCHRDLCAVGAGVKAEPNRAVLRTDATLSADANHYTGWPVTAPRAPAINVHEEARRAAGNPCAVAARSASRLSALFASEVSIDQTWRIAAAGRRSGLTPPTSAGLPRLIGHPPDGTPPSVAEVIDEGKMLCSWG